MFDRSSSCPQSTQSTTSPPRRMIRIRPTPVPLQPPSLSVLLRPPRTRGAPIRRVTPTPACTCRPTRAPIHAVHNCTIRSSSCTPSPRNPVPHRAQAAHLPLPEEIPPQRLGKLVREHRPTCRSRRRRRRGGREIVWVRDRNRLRRNPRQGCRHRSSSSNVHLCSRLLEMGQWGLPIQLGGDCTSTVLLVVQFGKPFLCDALAHMEPVLLPLALTLLHIHVLGPSS